jgi:hypothetical protein
VLFIIVAWSYATDVPHNIRRLDLVTSVEKEIFFCDAGLFVLGKIPQAYGHR